MPIIGIVLAACVMFCLAFIFFSYQAGFFKVTVKGPEEKKIKEPDAEKIKEIMAVLEKEKTLWDDRNKESANSEAQNSSVMSQVEVEKKWVESSKDEFLKMIEEINKNSTNRGEAEEKNVLLLAKMYSAMKPADAVKIFEKMNDDTAVSILAKMKPQVSSRILGKMKPSKGTLISEMLRMK